MILPYYYGLEDDAGVALQYLSAQSVLGHDSNRLAVFLHWYCFYNETVIYELLIMLLFLLMLSIFFKHAGELCFIILRKKIGGLEPNRK